MSSLEQLKASGSANLLPCTSLSANFKFYLDLILEYRCSCKRYHYIRIGFCGNFLPNGIVITE